jgi:uncharacterized oxidoreductase
MNISNNKILITGGASGIGLGLTQRFLTEGNTILICGRRESVLNEIKDQFPAVITFAADLSTAEGRVALYNWIASNHPDLNVLINNAGIQQWMNLSDPDFYQRAKEEIAINIDAPVHLASLFTQFAHDHQRVIRSRFLPIVQDTSIRCYESIPPLLHPFPQALATTKEY